MHSIRRLYILLLLISFQVKPVQSQDQPIDLHSLIAHHWVDSVFSSLSILEQIDQLLVLDIGKSAVFPNEYPLAYGGVLLSSTGPGSHANSVNAVQQELNLPAFIFSHLDESYWIQMDSILHFGSALSLAAVTEPYLIYETGQAIASQSKCLGIHGLYSHQKDIIQKKNGYDTWRLKEMKQGFTDQGVFPLNFIKLYTFKDFGLDKLMFQDEFAMLKIHPDNVPDFHEIIEKSLASGALQLEMLNAKCRQVLALKLWAGLDENQNINTIQLQNELNMNESRLLQYELAQASLTVLKNEDLLPVTELVNKRIASLTIGKADNTVLNEYLDNYTQVDHFQLSYDASDKDLADLWSKFNNYDLIIAAYYESELLNEIGIQIFQRWLNESGKCITAYFGNPTKLKESTEILKSSTLILAYEDNKLSNLLVPQLIFGAISSDGLLPVRINENYKNGDGIFVNQLERFAYTLPEEVGLDGDYFKKIDSIVYQSIKGKAIPGCQVLVARNNKVVYKKSFGYYTYDSLRKVVDSDLYDLASLTKVSGALPGLMKLYEEEKFDLDTTLGTYLPYFHKRNKKDLTFREILAHQAGLKSWIPYWKTTIKKNGKYRRKTLSSTESVDYPYEITEGLFLHKDYKDKIYKQIRKSKLGEKKYLYSGLIFYIFPDIIETITGEKYTDYMYANFYKPLGATSLTYNPLEKIDLDRIVPTEYDSVFRKTQIHGKVHDEGAAMMAGISSNAGLFANANDLAKLFQMFCNYGTYGGHKYLDEETVREFSSVQYPDNENRRGLGFDRPLLKPHVNGNTAKSVSQLSFGHSGFTGTFAWADPEYNLVYIFLSNRVYPTRENTILYKQNVRTNIQELIYQAIK